MRNFNEAQTEAIAHVDGPMMVLAGPGSGKTTVITQRVLQLIQKAGVKPASILVVTFTKAAAVEMKTRFKALMGGQYAPVSFGTFHSIFFSILKHAYGYEAASVVDEERKQLIFREIIEKYQLETEDESEFIAAIEGEISIVKGEMMNADHYYPMNCSADVFRKIYHDYQSSLHKYRLLDFDDMMVYTYELFSQRKDILRAWQQKFKYILIDEFQDVNRLQYEIIKMLADPLENLFIVGDDDQSIYHFRGARPEFMLNFESDYPTARRVVLNTNYRCSAPIVAVAEKCIRHNQNRFDKAMRAAVRTGRKVAVKAFRSPLEECRKVAEEIRRMHETEQVPYDHIAVLFRTNHGSRMMVNQLMGDNIPFKMKDHMPNLFEHWIMKNIYAYIRIAKGGTDRRDYLQIINRPNRYVSRQCFDSPQVDFEKIKACYEDRAWMAERLEEFEEDLHMIDTLPPFAALNYLRKAMGYENYLYTYALDRKIPPEDLIEVFDNIEESARPFKTYGAWFEYIEDYTEQIKVRQAGRDRSRADSVVLSTMHSAKGLEYDAVFLIDINEGIVPYQKAVLDEDIEEERRMFYVAMTRAKRYLDICYVKERHGREMEPSRFVGELLEK